jgi:biopolymer transport protein ExbB
MNMAASEHGNDGTWFRVKRALTAPAARVLIACCLFGSVAMAITCVTPAVAVAQDEGDVVDESAEGGGSKESLLVYIAEACGWIFGPVFLLLSFVFVALVVMCFLQIRKTLLLPESLSAQFEQHLEAKEYQPAYELAKNDDSYLGHVLAAGMSKLQAGYGEAMASMEEAQGVEQMKLEHKISYISLIGALAPMLGLLGTVQGMVDSFKKISDNPGVAPKPDQLASGIATALVTTLIGLWIAIPAISFFHLFRNRLEEINSDASEESTRLMAR